MRLVKFSSRGRFVIPGSIRAAHGWKGGTEFTVEDRPEGLLLKPRCPFPPAAANEVFGCLRYGGPAKTVEEMDEDVARSVANEWRLPDDGSGA